MRILIVDLFPSIWNHSLLLNQLSTLLSKNSKEFSIIKLECGETFPSHCLSRDYLKNTPSLLENGKNSSCKTCNRNSKILDWNGNIPMYQLSDYVKYDEAEKYLTSLTNLETEKILKFRYKNINVGELATYELILKYKKREMKLSEQEKNEYLENIRNWILTFDAAMLILEKAKPDRIIIFNPQYSINSAVAKASKTLGIPVYAAECSDALNKQYSNMKLTLWREKFSLDALTSWPGKEYQATPSQKLAASLHFEKIKQATSVFTYSSKPTGKSPREFFKIPSESKMILVALSSSDEFFAGLTTGLIEKRKAISEVFHTQNDWIRFLLGFAQRKPGWFFVIRLHPREFPNKRENRLSESAHELTVTLSKIPDNVRIDTPENNLSITDYFSEIDVFTTGWSNSALEAGYEGIPVVTYDRQMPFFPPDLYLSGDNQSEYVQNLNLAMRRGRDLSFKEATLNWISWSTIEGTFELGGRTTDRLDTLGMPARNIFSRIHPRIMKFIDARLPVNMSDAAEIYALLQSGRENHYSVDISRNTKK